ncbi:MAG: RNA methyltransferase [Gordonia sp. (in: high G+C Gram-positive bacteria)]|uniref:TrmH family RNA methyltransferase n=1 Tax=Gordonia sp. (in: high G+C Gram-positive bacteria) TaxID=84139 RepID=UPI0039E41FAD
MDVLTERSSRVVSLAKLHRASVRRSTGTFLAEGANAVDAALSTGRAQQLLVRHDDADPAAENRRHADLIARAEAARLPVHRLSPRAADKLSETTTAPGIFAVCGLLTDTPDRVDLSGDGFAVVAVEPREPGNAGTLIRCADAMGAKAVLLLGDAVDVHNGKCVRASAGSVFHVPLIVERDVAAGLARLREAGLRTLATTMDGEVPLPEADDLLAEPHAWLFGNEAHGLSEREIAGADHRVSIPIHGRAESLNLAAASAICLYASATARRRA